MDDDSRIEAGVRLMARPRPAPSGAREQVIGAVTRKRRRRVVGRSALALGAVGLVVVGLTTLAPAKDRGVTVGREDQRNPRLVVHASDYGFLVEMTVGFTDRRDLISGVFDLSGTTFPVAFYPNDGTDNDVQPSPLPLAAGTTVTSSATLVIDCSVEPAAPRLELTSRQANGHVRRDGFSTANPQSFARDVHDWCGSGVRATIASASAPAPEQPGGEVHVGLRIVNPGPQAVTVTSDDFRAGEAHWLPARLVVAPGHTAVLTLRAENGRCGSAETPWSAGRLRAGGRVIQVADGTSWC